MRLLQLRFVLMLGSLALACPNAAGQTPEADTPTALSEAEEIAMARSAAPAGVSAKATILVLRNDRYVEARRGTNGNTCLVARSRPSSLEPICYGPEASATILPMELRRYALRHTGLSPEQIERRLAAAIEAGELSVPSRPALAFMMSPRQVLYSEDGRRVGRWFPHVHIYYPYLTSEELGLHGPPHLSAPIVADEGEPTASIIVVVREFTAAEDSGGGGGSAGRRSRRPAGSARAAAQPTEG